MVIYVQFEAKLGVVRHPLMSASVSVLVLVVVAQWSLMCHPASKDIGIPSNQIRRIKQRQPLAP